MKIYVVSVCGSSEYGCSVHSAEGFKTIEKAKKALKNAFKEAKDEFDCETFQKENDMSFSVSDYECSYDCISGKITECEL